MPLNPLFWLLVLTGGACAGVSLWARRRDEDADQPVRDGRLPGYSRTSGEDLSIDESAVALDGGVWRPKMLETFHSSERSRLLLTIELTSSDERFDEPELRDFLERLAREVQARTSATVVYIEAEHASGGLDRLLYAPDGLGWTGHERLQMVRRDAHGELDWR